MKNRPCKISKVVHDDVDTPEQNFLLAIVFILIFTERWADVIKNADYEPHPEVVLSSEQFWLPIVNGMLKIVFANSEESVSVYIEVSLHLYPKRTPKI